MSKIFLYYGTKRQLMTSINTQKLKLGTIPIFIIGAMIALPPIVMSIDAYAAGMMRESRSSALAEGGPGDTAETGISGINSCQSKMLTDSPEGNSLGWTPDGEDTIFVIEDSCFLKADSTVLVNIKDGGANFEVCNVVYATEGNTTDFFEVFCSAPPADGSELHYIVFWGQKDIVGMEAPTPEAELPSDISARQQNSTQQ